jgi:hypothetical protein
MIGESAGSILTEIFFLGIKIGNGMIILCKGDLTTEKVMKEFSGFTW